MKTVVLLNPDVRVVDGKYRFTGKRADVSQYVDGENRVLDYLKSAGVYNSQQNVWNEPVNFSKEFSAKTIEQVDEILSLIDRNRLRKDVKKGFGFLRGNNIGDFQDYRNKGFIANTDTIVQGTVYKKLKEEGFNIRHFTTQEAIEKMYSDDDFKDIQTYYWSYACEVIQNLEEQKTNSYNLENGILNITEGSSILVPKEVSAVRFNWIDDVVRPDVDSDSPLGRYGYGVAGFVRSD